MPRTTWFAAALVAAALVARGAILPAARADDVSAPPARIYHVLKYTFACQNPRAVRALTDPLTARPQDRDWVSFFVTEGKCSHVNPSSDWEKLSADGDLALMVNRAHRAWGPLFFRNDTIDEGHDAPPAPDPTIPTVSAAFTDGQAARRAWDEWLNGLQGEQRAGAEDWAKQWAAPEAGLCFNSSQHSLTKDWQGGCLAARAHSVASDVRRRSEPDYAQGWNSPEADPAAGPVVPDPAAAAAVSADIARAKRDAEDRKTASFKAGALDRKRWDEWFSGFLGDYRDGAAFWYAQLDKHPAPASCADPAHSESWRDGCKMAMRKLEGLAARRQTDPLYARGWDSAGAINTAGTPEVTSRKD
jgi:hypothetical protein